MPSRNGTKSAMPAFAIMMSWRPNALTHACTAAWFAARVATSPTWTIACPPFVRMVAATSSSTSLCQPKRTTPAPSRAKDSAVARPMPRPAPVTTTPLPSNLRAPAIPSALRRAGDHPCSVRPDTWMAAHEIEHPHRVPDGVATIADGAAAHDPPPAHTRRLPAIRVVQRGAPQSACLLDKSCGLLRRQR